MRAIPFAALVGAVLLLSVPGEMQSICCTPKNAWYHIDIMAGQYIDVGDMQVEIVEIGGDYALGVTYILDPDNNWYLFETHLAAVCDDPAYIPQTPNGNPIPGQFPYFMDHDPYSDKVASYLIPAADFGECETMVAYIAAHAEVVLLDEHGDIIQEETAWAGCVGDCCFEFDEEPVQVRNLIDPTGNELNTGDDPVKGRDNWATYFAFGRLPME